MKRSEERELRVFIYVNMTAAFLVGGFLGAAIALEHVSGSDDTEFLALVSWAIAMVIATTAYFVTARRTRND